MGVINKGNMNIKVPAGCIHYGSKGTQDATPFGNPDSCNPSGTAMSVSFWLKLDDPTNTASYLFYKRSRAGYGWYTYNTSTGKVNCFLQTSVTSVNPNIMDTPPSYEWNQIGFTYDGSYLRYYVNGELSGSTALTGKIHSDTTQNISAGLYLSGCLHDLQMWSGLCLSPEQMRQVYNGSLDLSEKRVLNIECKDTWTDTSITDSSIYGNDGTFTNNARWEYRDIKCWDTRWDEDNYNVVIETFMDPSDRNYLFEHVNPGSVRELYNILGVPRYIDTTYTSGNTLIIEPIEYGISSLREKRTIAVKNISDTFINKDTFNVKIEGIRLI